ncbi:hypothetical protein [Marinomonas primoryensis]|uniref:Uncharacterized protein n=1 Tax=Marinomonas primoryensis TaxID=178399 RepID=A0ABV0L0X8_9GAMM
MNYKKQERYILLFLLSVFLFMLILIYSEGLPYQNSEFIDEYVFPWTSLITFFLIIIASIFIKGTEDNPAGLRALAKLYKNGEYRTFLKALFALTLFSIMFGYFVFSIAAHIPAIPTRIIVNDTFESDATCITTGRTRIKGSWSLFRLNSGEEWKISGFGHICPKSEKQCRLTYSEGTLGYYVRNIVCSDN